MLNEYRKPTTEQLAQLEQTEDLYCQIENFIRQTLKSSSFRQQALFRLRESETWVKEGIKAANSEEPDEPAARP